MSKLLIIEDNESLAKSLEGWLTKHYEVSIVSTGSAAIKAVIRDEYDVILLDLGLPDMPGQEVCQAIRSRGIKTPILVLTASSGISTKVTLFDIGADDYVLKPFYVGELQARLRALMRRDKTSQHNQVMRVGDLTLDSTRRQVARGGKPIELRRKEFDILEYLMQNRGTVLTRAMIISNSWEDGADRWNNTVDVHIKYLRDKIDRPFKKPLIKTAYGVGYMIDDE